MSYLETLVNSLKHTLGIPLFAHTFLILSMACITILTVMVLFILNLCSVLLLLGDYLVEPISRAARLYVRYSEGSWCAGMW